MKRTEGPGFKNGRHWTQTARGRKKMRAIAALRSSRAVASLAAHREKVDIGEFFNALWQRLTLAEKRATLRSIIERGYSLIELMIVVAVILIISAIAIPRLLSAYQASEESAGASTMRNTATALQMYNLKYSAFPAALTNLGGTCNATTLPTATAACLMDNVVVSAMPAGPVNNYVWTYTQVNNGSDFTLLADPATGVRAQRHYFVDSGLTIHASATAAATATDPTL